MRELINFDEPIPYRNGYGWREKQPTKEERETDRIFCQCYNHIAGKRTFRDEYKLILEKKSTLPAVCRKFIIEQAKEWQPEQKL